MEAASPLEEDGFVVEEVEIKLADTRFRGFKEIGVESGKEVAITPQGVPDADETGDAMGFDQLCHLSVEIGFRQSGLQYVAHDESPAAMLAVVLDIVERDCKGVEVEAIRVVDKERVVESFVHLQPHGHGRETQTTTSNGVRVIAKVAEQGHTMERVFD